MSKTMEDYIKETTSVLLGNIDKRQALVQPLIEELVSAGVRQKKILVFVASGSSYNAIMCARSFMLQRLKSKVRLITPFEFCYYEEQDDNNVYLFVSQSGCSTNVYEAVEKYQKAGGRAIAVLGNLDSTIGQMADKAFEYGVGEESVGYVTKGVITLSGYCMLLALELTAEEIGKSTYEEEVREMKGAALNHHSVYQYARGFCREHEKAFLSMEHVMLMASGANLGTAREGALKLAEMVHVQTTYYEVEEFIHGPNLQVDPSYTLFFIDGGDGASDRIREISYASQALTDKCYLISASEFGLDKLDEAFTPLYLTAFFQYLAFWVARELKINGDHPFYERFKERVKNKTGDYKDTSPF
ncbi:SIS domain-containing protein [Ohessyouella blattaphilus]|uniref:SIS domain-containing protein n=1 Tax=Ohessyouella blattaphilus TaxID=2949333 RepID=A0ABT1EI72_9FIRM|nr:SIS domain-containing protein [Ohessyouella blattaphilus]MCP1110395.1 SIS domain-containing protein [Ohessyouella blattaphilus]MCR8563789.1 SIS domain-containing protein [Ohessyouella blattaphilus]